MYAFVWVKRLLDIFIINVKGGRRNVGAELFCCWASFILFFFIPIGKGMEKDKQVRKYGDSLHAHPEGRWKRESIEQVKH